LQAITAYPFSAAGIRTITARCVPFFFTFHGSYFINSVFLIFPSGLHFYLPEWSGFYNGQTVM
jgi:hypothetical protein